MPADSAGCFVTATDPKASCSDAAADCAAKPSTRSVNCARAACSKACSCAAAFAFRPMRHNTTNNSPSSRTNPKTCQNSEKKAIWTIVSWVMPVSPLAVHS